MCVRVLVCVRVRARARVCVCVCVCMCVCVCLEGNKKDVRFCCVEVDFLLCFVAILSRWEQRIYTESRANTVGLSTLIGGIRVI